MPRFFIRANQIEDGVVTLLGDDAHHISRSLRMAVGDEISVLDDTGTEYTCRLFKIRDEVCVADIISSKEGKTELCAEVSLYMGYPKGDKLEIVIQKAVELGASRIIPFESSRCVKRPNPEKAEKQGKRLSKIAEEAAKQCGRSRLPEVLPPISFKAAISEARDAELCLFCYEGDGAVSLKSALSSAKSPKSISVMVGCEGGFSKEEAEAAIGVGLTAVNLGPRILRCETAPSYVLSCISYAFELE